jgi:hypothetical protein
MKVASHQTHFSIFQHVVLSAANGAIAGQILGIIGQALMFLLSTYRPS